MTIVPPPRSEPDEHVDWGDYERRGWHRRGYALERELGSDPHHAGLTQAEKRLIAKVETLIRRA